MGSPNEKHPVQRRGWSKWWAVPVVATVALVQLSSKITYPQFENANLAADIVLAELETNLAEDWSRHYTAEAHLAGTNYPLVEWTRAKFEEYGLKASVDEYNIFVSYPESHALHLLKNDSVVYSAPLEEDEIEEDPTSVGDGRVPTFLLYAANGNVTAEYVYVNYGRREDFAQLAEWGVSVAGKIAVIRYGGIFRGLKVKFAQEHGAVGVLLYTDPGDDYGITPKNGYKQYPDGPARHESSVQRGSVQFLGGLGSAPGDPTTPGWASKGDAKRVDPHGSIGKIPVLPILYREVKPILAALNKHGKATPDAWHGELDGFKYHTGPSPNVTLNLYLNQTFNITPLWNVYGAVDGEKKSETIYIGNHRDAWIRGGAGDPNSGSAVLIELARAFGALQKAGVRLKRPIVLQSYDGEEYGLLGSTEYGEYQAKHLKANALAYLNMDVAVRGKYLSLGASPVLNRALIAAAKKLPYPEGGTLYEHFEKRGGEISNLGSGSDYTVFLEHLGIPSTDIGFNLGKGDPVYQYHSNYDLFYWMSKFGDKGFVYHNLAAKYLALVALELAQGDIVRFSLGDYAESILGYFKEVKRTIPKAWFHHTVEEKLVEQYATAGCCAEGWAEEGTSGYYSRNYKWPFPELSMLLCRGNKAGVAGKHKNHTLGDLLHHTERQLTQLHKAVVNHDIEGERLQKRVDNRGSLHWWQRIALAISVRRHNKHSQYFERNFLHHDGLDGRPWFKHIVFAAGRYTGYAGQTLPGLREAIEDESQERLVKWLGIVAKSARRISKSLGQLELARHREVSSEIKGHEHGKHEKAQKKGKHEKAQKKGKHEKHKKHGNDHHEKFGEGRKSRRRD